MKSFMGAHHFFVNYMRLILIFSVRFIKVANETMCRPIRALTEARGHAMSKHVYVYFILYIFLVFP